MSNETPLPSKAATPETQKSHTQSPWHLELSGDGAWSIDAKPPYRITSIVIICNRAVWSHNAQESEANGRLIAAAPELLDACIDALDTLSDQFAAEDGPTGQKLRNAIKKATTSVQKGG